MHRVMNVVGARPQFIKAGPVSRILDQAGVEEVLVHTGQHYDDLLSDTIMRDVGLREPDFNLGVGSGTHGFQTARMLEGLERLMLDTAPSGVLTYGDTNSTVAAALAATKLDIFTAHVEAGLRSFNRQMPEELNRVATDHLSDLLLAPTKTAMDHLGREGLAERSALTGDVMLDALRSIDVDKVALPPWSEGVFFIATLHRPSNTDDPGRLSEILAALNSLPHPVHVLAHPRLRHRIAEFHIDALPDNITLRDPLPYSVMIAAMTKSAGLLTDSGGLQKEAFLLSVPCATVRSETEWPETLLGGWNVLVGDRLAELGRLVERRPNAIDDHPFGDGSAAEEIVDRVLERIS